MKKWLSILCVLALLLSLGASAFASSEEPSAEASAETSAETEEQGSPSDEIQFSFGAVPEADPAIYDGVVTVINHNGLKLTYHKDSGVSLIFDEDSGYYFKDLKKTGSSTPTRTGATPAWRAQRTSPRSCRSSRCSA